MKRSTVTSQLTAFVALFFAGATRLAYHMALVVPSTVGNVTITPEAHQGYVDYVVSRMEAIFGATNVSFGYGTWEGIKENNAVVASYFDNITADQFSDFSSLVATMQSTMQQQCMAVIVNGEMLIWSRPK
jgi:hypothetical protein